jgi:hypothetical protein
MTPDLAYARQAAKHLDASGIFASEIQPVETIAGPLTASCSEIGESVSLIADTTFSLAWTGLGDAGFCEVMRGDPCNQ